MSCHLPSCLSIRFLFASTCACMAFRWRSCTRSAAVIGADCSQSENFSKMYKKSLKFYAPLRIPIFVNSMWSRDRTRSILVRSKKNPLYWSNIKRQKSPSKNWPITGIGNGVILLCSPLLLSVASSPTIDDSITASNRSDRTQLFGRLTTRRWRRCCGRLSIELLDALLIMPHISVGCCCGSLNWVIGCRGGSWLKSARKCSVPPRDDWKSSWFICSDIRCELQSRCLIRGCSTVEILYKGQYSDTTEFL